MSDLNKPPETMDEAMEREYPPATKEPCNDCPWRKIATAGWLGPGDAESWLEAIHSETAIACHMTIPRGGGWGEQTRQCRGAASFRAHVEKRPRNPSIETGPPDESVFATDAEFRAHHTEGEEDADDVRSRI